MGALPQDTLQILTMKSQEKSPQGSGREGKGDPMEYDQSILHKKRQLSKGEAFARCIPAGEGHSS